jgi:hypothetical protein
MSRAKPKTVNAEDQRLLDEWRDRHEAALKDHALRRQRDEVALPDPSVTIFRRNGEGVPQ